MGLGWDGRLAFGLMGGDGDCWCGLEVVSWRGLFRSEFCPAPIRSEASPIIKFGMDSEDDGMNPWRCRSIIVGSLPPPVVVLVFGEICITPFREMLGIYVGYIAARITFVSMSAESSILLIMYIL